MVVMVLEKVPSSLRGELTRWMLEIQTGVFVGAMSALVRDLLWSKCLTKMDEGTCCQVYRTNNEQGFSIRLLGDSARGVVNLEGLELVGVKNARWEKLVLDGSSRSLTSEEEP